MGNALQFPDVSHYNAGVNVDGSQAVLCKATQGVGGTDATYVERKARAAQLGQLFGGYHWIDTSPIPTQAAWAYKHIGGVPAMWDAEAAGATVPRLVEMTRAYRQLGGIVNLVYLPRWWWHDDLGSPSLQPLIDAGLSLVASHYTASYDDNSPGRAPYGGMTPAILQWTDKYPAPGGAIDMNAFKGTIQQLTALFYGQNGPAAMTTAPYSPATATAVAIGATDVGWVDHPGEVGWDSDLRVYNLRRLVLGDDGATPPVAGEDTSKYNLRAIVAAIGSGGGLTDADRTLIAENTAAAKRLSDQLAAIGGVLAGS
jgi:hypothetical protein